MTDDTGASNATLQTGFVPALSSATTSTYLDASGQVESNVYPSAVNYTDPATGDWAPIDTTLVPSPGAEFAVQNAANSFTAKIPTDPSTSPVELSQAGQWVTMRLHGVAHAPADIDDATATFDDVSKADSVSYESTNVGLKESINLAAPPSGHVVYRYSLDTSDGLTPRLRAGGRLEFTNSAGASVFVMPAGTMIDSAASPHVSGRVAYGLRPTAGGWTLTVTPDLGWLTDSDRVYPVAIDPTLATAQDTGDCYLGSSSPDAGHCSYGNNTLFLRAGRSDSAHKYRSLLKFDVTTIPATAVVSSATVHMNLDASQTLNPGVTSDYAFYLPGKAYDSSATWNSAGAAGAWTGGSPGPAAYGTHSWSGATGGDKAFVGFASLVQSWRNGSTPNRGLVFKQVSEADNNVLYFYSASPSNYGKLPYLSVQYTLVPAVPGAPTAGPLDSAGQVSATPVLTATPVSNDGGQVSAEFQIQDQSGTVVDQRTSSPVASNSHATVQVPAFALSVTNTYTVRARAVEDSVTSAWSPITTFTVDSAPTIDYSVPTGTIDPYGPWLDPDPANDDGSGDADDDDSSQDPALTSMPASGWSVTTQDPVSGATSTFGPSDPAFADSPDLSKSSWWDAQCPGDDYHSDLFKVVKEFPRLRVAEQMVGSEAYLNCGHDLPKKTVDPATGTHRFGLRHIRNKHKAQFAELAGLEGGDWGSFMYWTMWHTTKEPNNVTLQNHGYWCVEKIFTFHNINGTHFERTMVTILGATGRRVMSDFPRKNHNLNCQGAVYYPVP